VTPLDAGDVLAIAERVIGDDVAHADVDALRDLPAEPADLVYRLVTRPVFPRHNQAIAVLALLEMLQRNGCDADLEPADELAALLTTPDLNTLSRWLDPRINKEHEMFERFTDLARQVVVNAQESARDLGHNYIGTEHLLLGLCMLDQGVGPEVLADLGVQRDKVKAEVERIIGRGPSEPSRQIPFTPRTKKVLELALKESRKLKHNYIGTEHILLGMIREGEGVAAQVLVRLGADLPLVRGKLLRQLTGDTPRSASRAVLMQELEAVFEENDRLRAENASLRAQNEKLRGTEATA